jgi:hypothetical protein
MATFRNATLLDLTLWSSTTTAAPPSRYAFRSLLGSWDRLVRRTLQGLDFLLGLRSVEHFLELHTSLQAGTPPVG